MKIAKYLLKTCICLAFLWASPGFAQEPIKIGTTQSLTGRFAQEGAAQLAGLKMWAEDVNARGQLLGRPVELGCTTTGRELLYFACMDGAIRIN